MSEPNLTDRLAKPLLTLLMASKCDCPLCAAARIEASKALVEYDERKGYLQGLAIAVEHAFKDRE